MKYNRFWFPLHVDSAVSGRWMAGCWFFASWGVAVFQAILQVQVYKLYQLATPVACVTSVWIVGTVLGSRIGYALRRFSGYSGPFWMIIYLMSCILGWLAWIFLLSRSTPTIETLINLSLVALLMGVTSTCWLTASRPWPVPGEHITLIRGLVCLTLGLCVTWILPQWAWLIGLLLLLPLVCIDLIPAVYCPVPFSSGMNESFLRSTSDPATWRPLQLRRDPYWWLPYLARRRQLLSAVLIISFAAATGGLWSSVPTLFAAHLSRTHQIWTLTWLVGGQLAALALGGFLFSRSRGTVGLTDKVIPLVWQQRCWRLAKLSLFALSVSLIFLGLPWLQAAWSLAASIFLYTLAGAAWGILINRLKPSISTQSLSHRHLLFSTEMAISNGQLAFESELENRVNLHLDTFAGILTALSTPLCGTLIDHSTFDDTLIVGGLFLLLLTLVTLPFQSQVPSIWYSWSLKRWQM